MFSSFNYGGIHIISTTEEYRDTPSYWDGASKRLTATTSINMLNWSYKYMRANLIRLCLKAISIIKHPESPIKILKTDLWNEGVEFYKDVINMVKKLSNVEINFFGVDISKLVIFKALNRLKYIYGVQASITHLPFRDCSFDIVWDISTIDHIPLKLREKVIEEYFRTLKSKGVLILITDSQNIFTKLTRSTILNNILGINKDSIPSNPNLLKVQLQQYFEILDEGCLDVGYAIRSFLFSGRKSRIFKFILDKEPIFRALHKIESSNVSRFLTPISRQYFFICRGS